MADRPILFSAPMVRALLDGTKTQTRRVLKPQPHGSVIQFGYFSKKGAGWTDEQWNSHPLRIWAGDRLWVREAIIKTVAGVAYAADGRDHYGAGGKLRCTPPIHMPRWASRLTLIVTDVRVERLQGISRGDCVDEGCPFPNMAKGPNPRDWYADLWDSINGAGAWNRNPWVVAYSFTVHRSNIDAMEAT